MSLLKLNEAYSTTEIHDGKNHSDDTDQEKDKRDLKVNEKGYTSIIDYLVKNERVEQAYEVLNLMKSHGVAPNAITYTSIMHTYLSLSLGLIDIDLTAIQKTNNDNN